MPVFEYTALTEEGAKQRGTTDGDSARDVQTKLRALDLYVTHIVQKTDLAGEGEKKARVSLPSRARVRQICLATSQFATLISAGVPMVECLTVLIEQAEKQSIATVLIDVQEKLKQGASLGAAMRHHPKYFDDLYLAMIEAGEASGELDVIMKRISEFLDRRSRTQEKVLTAMAYPAIMAVVGVLVVSFLMVVVVPQITGILQERQQALPLPTEILIGISNLVRDFWWALGAGALGAPIALLLYRATERGRYVTDKIKLRLPVFGTLFRKQSVSRFSVTFSTLLKSGIPVLDCLEILEDVVSNAVLRETLITVREKITTGTDISTPLKESGVFPPLVGYMVAVGEESGQLESILDKLAETYEQEVDEATERMTRLLEPALILAMAGVVGFIVMAILLPILNMSQVM